MTTFTVDNIKELEEAADKILTFAEDQKFFAFYGEMGAGKTTLINVICSKLAIVDKPSSPTYSIVNEYITKTNKRMFHFDFYRIKNLDELFEMGYEEYFYKGDYCFVEWPEKIESFLPKNLVKITLAVQPNLSREITLQHVR